MKKTLALVSMAVVVAVLVTGLAGGFGTSSTPTVYASRLAGIVAAGVTGIQVQNLDAAQQATVVADFYNQKPTGGPVSITLPPIPAAAAANIFLPAYSQLQNGAYAAIISGDRQLAAIARTDWTTSGGAAIYSNVLPSTDVALALAVKEYYGQTSLVSVQNTDPSAQATVEVKLFKKGETAAAKTVSLPISPGTSITIDLGKDSNFADIAAGFLGSMRFTSATPIGVQSFVDIATSEKAVYAFEGVPSEMAAAKLYAPLFRSRQNVGSTTSRLDTGISVVNPTGNPVQVSVSYTGSGGSCAGQTFTEGPVTIGAGSSNVFYQGPGGGFPGPANCFGSATIQATGGNVLAIVNDSQDLTKLSAAYNAVSDAQGAMMVALPLVRHKHTVHKLTTGVQVMNVGSGPANITIAFKDSTGTAVSGCGGDCARSGLATGGSHTFWPGGMSGIMTGWVNKYGSATVSSDQPVVVIVNDYPEAGTTDAATYNGIKADQ